MAALRAGAVAAVALLALGVPLRAQSEVVDRGTFVLTRDGKPAGVEEFTIRRQPSVTGPVLRAQANVAAGPARLASDLTTTADGAPLSYTLEVRHDGRRTEQLLGQFARGRMTVRTSGGGGDAAREYLAGDDAAIIDGDLVHQHWFLVRRPAGAATRVIAPRTGARTTVRVREVGPDAVEVGGVSLPATRLSIEGIGDGVREAWIDGDGRLLRLSIPASRMVATRQAPPV